jgi:AcrR family transcriptional regulator
MSPRVSSSRTAARHRRQFEERDRRIREAARTLLLERGLHGFSMEDIAEAIDYSKGTVYQHYECKEDALVACCAESGAELATLFERAAALPGSTRDRMSALVEAYTQFVERKAVPVRVMPLVHSPTVLEKASPERRAAMESSQSRVRGICASIVADAVREGDLAPGPGIDPRTIPFALWAMLVGSFLLTELHTSEKTFGVTDPGAAVRTQWAIYMDGLGWKPHGGGRAPRGLARRVRSLLPPSPSAEAGR